MMGFLVILSRATGGSEVEGPRLGVPRITAGLNMRKPASRSFDSDSHGVLVSAQDDGWFDSDLHGVLVFAQEDEWEAMR